MTLYLVTGSMFLLVCGSSNVSAQTAPAVESSTFSQQQKLQLDQTISDFTHAMDNKDYSEVVDLSIPPNVLEYLAGMGGIELSLIKPQVGKMMRMAMESVETFDYAFLRDDIEYFTLPNGSQYAIIPSVVTMSGMGNTVRSFEDTFAMYDDNRWYLMRVSDANQVRIMRVVYPQYSDVEFKPGRMERVQ